MQPLDCAHSVFFHVGTGDTATGSPRLIKGVFGALSRMGKRSGAQLVFLILQVIDRDTESKGHAQDLAPGFVPPPELCFPHPCENLL